MYISARDKAILENDKRKKLKKPKENFQKEAEIQTECVRWFRENYPDYLIWSVPNEAAHSRWAKFSAMGALSGVADLTVVMPDRVVFVEMKDHKGEQRDSQKVFEGKVTDMGYSYYVCRSLEDFQSIFK